MSNTDKSVRSVPGEEVIFEIRSSKFILVSLMAVLALAICLLIALFYFVGINNIFIFIAIAFVGLLIELIIFLWWRSTVFRLTTKRVENRYGIIASREEQITLDDIQAVDVENNFWGAIFNYGTVMVKAAGAEREVDFTNIQNAKVIANQIEDLSTRYKRKHNIAN
jgi:uncharacterized membrane protein YdbT with pleckstrin-like domain